MLRISLVALGISALPFPAAAGCRIALVLGIDVSRSINAADYAIQQQGLLDALADPEVRDAFLKAGDPVAVAVFEWSGQDSQALISDWMMIAAPADLNTLSGRIAVHQRLPGSLPTALGSALEFAHGLLDIAPAECRAQVLDISGDGRNNDGRSVAKVYAEYDFSAVTVNGLAIGEHESGLADYFRRDLIRGPGAFVELAPTQGDFPEAIRRKLIRELIQQVSDAADGPATGVQG